MRLIDADALPSVKFHALPYTHIAPSDVNVESYERGWNDAIDAIVDCATTIDAVPVVRCRDCKYSDTFSDECEPTEFPLKCLSIRYGGVYPDWYCEHGVPKDGDA